jgi:hypothetical protein
MGATSRFETVPRCSEAELQKRFRNIVEEQQHEDGHDAYAGTFGSGSGLAITNKTFASDNEAHNWIADNAEKWGNILAVKVGDFNAGYFGTKAGKALLEKLEALVDESDVFDTNLVKRAKAGKSKFRSCPKCESKIAVKYLGGYGGFSSSERHAYFKVTACPVCGSEFLRTPTDQKRYDSLQARLTKVKQEVAKRKKEETTGGAHWLLGGIVAT